MTMFARRVCFALFFAGWGVTSSVATASEIESSGTLSLGFRTDSLDWNIDGGSGGPNILSELEWSDMDILLLKAEIRSVNREGIVFRGNIDYGWVLDGVNRDSDYAGNDRTSEYSRSVNDVDGSNVWDMSGGLGFTFYLGAEDRFQIIPMVGYSFHSQQLNMTNGFQVIPAFGSFPGLNSSYDAEWSGPWLGADFLWALQNDNSVFLRLEFHQVNYSAEANWNLRPEFAHPVSFEHEANGRGTILEFGWQNALVESSWVVGVSVMLQDWSTESGTDRTYFVDPAPPCSGNCYSEGKLNEVNWSSSSINFTLQKAFAN